MSVTIGMAGAGGLGGVSDAHANHGAPGTSATCFDFMKNIACQ
jgi:hypothetical protein